MPKRKLSLKFENGVYGKRRVIRGYKNYKKLYVLKEKKLGYYITDTIPVTLDSMVAINGEYWFRTLKELKKELGIK
jgi:hypothetical protein